MRERESNCAMSSARVRKRSAVPDHTYVYLYVCIYVCVCVCVCVCV